MTDLHQDISKQCFFIESCCRCLYGTFPWRNCSVKPLVSTIQKNFLIWISRSFKKEASDNIICNFDQSFRFSGLWLILARDLGRPGQNKSWGTEREHVILFLNFWIVRFVYFCFSGEIINSCNYNEWCAIFDWLFWYWSFGHFTLR